MANLTTEVLLYCNDFLRQMPNVNSRALVRTKNRWLSSSSVRMNMNAECRDSKKRVFECYENEMKFSFSQINIKAFFCLK